MSNKQKGFSLLEAVIVAGLIAIIAAVFLPTFFNTIKNYRAQTSAEQITMNLRFARMAAVKKLRRYQVTFSADPTNAYAVLMDENKDGSFEKYPNADTSIPDGVKILSGGITSVTFNARGAATIVGGSTIRVQLTDDFIYRITVSSNGAVTKQRE